MRARTHTQTPSDARRRTPVRSTHSRSWQCLMDGCSPTCPPCRPSPNSTTTQSLFGSARACARVFARERVFPRARACNVSLRSRERASCQPCLGGGPGADPPMTKMGRPVFVFLRWAVSGASPGRLRKASIETSTISRRTTPVPPRATARKTKERS